MPVNAIAWAEGWTREPAVSRKGITDLGLIAELGDFLRLGKAWIMLKTSFAQVIPQGLHRRTGSKPEGTGCSLRAQVAV